MQKKTVQRYLLQKLKKNSLPTVEVTLKNKVA